MFSGLVFFNRAPLKRLYLKCVMMSEYTVLVLLASLWYCRLQHHDSCWHFKIVHVKFIWKILTVFVTSALWGPSGIRPGSRFFFALYFPPRPKSLGVNISNHLYAVDIHLYCSFKEFYKLSSLSNCLSDKRRFLQLNSHKRETLITDNVISEIRQRVSFLDSSAELSFRLLGVIFNSLMWWERLWAVSIF